MSITSIGASSVFGTDSASNGSQPSAAETANADSSFQALLGDGDSSADDQAKDMLAEITQGGAAGYWAWQVQQMKQQATADVMGSMDLTPAKIAAMDTKTRVATEEKIEQLVEQKVKQEIADHSKKKQEQTLAASASMQGLISATQSVNGKKFSTQAANPNDPTDLLLFGSS